MTAADYAGLLVSVFTIIGSFVIAVRYLVRTYLKDIWSEFKPDGNGGHNTEGRLKRVEEQIDKIYQLLLER